MQNFISLCSNIYVGVSQFEFHFNYDESGLLIDFYICNQMHLSKTKITIIPNDYTI